MEQKKHGTAEHVEQENGRRKKISVNFMINRMQIAHKHKIKMLKMTKKYGKFVDIGRTEYYDTDMEQVP